MQIALCDDEITNHEKTRELIRQYKQIHSDRTLSLSSFASGKELINHVDEHGGFDLYILDCIMPEMNGIELGAALRMRDDTGFLIYLTTSPAPSSTHFSALTNPVLLTSPINSASFLSTT